MPSPEALSLWRRDPVTLYVAECLRDARLDYLDVLEQSNARGDVEHVSHCATVTKTLKLLLQNFEE